MEDKYLCEACDAPLDDNFSLCDECFRVMPVDRMVSVSDIRELRREVAALSTTKNVPIPEWLPSELYGEAVMGWRLTTDNRHRDWRYQIITERSVYTARTDGKVISVGFLNSAAGGK